MSVAVFLGVFAVFSDAAWLINPLVAAGLLDMLRLIIVSLLTLDRVSGCVICAASG